MANSSDASASRPNPWEGGIGPHAADPRGPRESRRTTLILRDPNGSAAELYWRSPADRRLRENAVISVHTRQTERPLAPHALSIKTIRGGREEFNVRGQHLLLEDDAYLVLNCGQAYASRITASEEVQSFQVFFSPAFVHQTLEDDLTAADRILERGSGGGQWFAEQLFEHDRSVSPVLRYVERVCISGHTDEAWYEEQLRLLLHRMLARHREVIARIGRLPAIKRSTRVEIYRRLVRAKDYILSHYDQPLSIRDIAEVSCLSISHLHVLFKELFGFPPHQFLQHKRIAVACRLLLGEDNLSDIAARVGMESRSTFFRAFRRINGSSPQAYRRQQIRVTVAQSRSSNFSHPKFGS